MTISSNRFSPTVSKIATTKKDQQTGLFHALSFCFCHKQWLARMTIAQSRIANSTTSSQHQINETTRSYPTRSAELDLGSRSEDIARVVVDGTSDKVEMYFTMANCRPTPWGCKSGGLNRRRRQSQKAVAGLFLCLIIELLLLLFHHGRVKGTGRHSSLGRKQSTSRKTRGWSTGAAGGMATGAALDSDSISFATSWPM